MFCGNLKGFLFHVIYKKNSFTSYSLMWMPFSFPNVITLVRTSCTILNTIFFHYLNILYHSLLASKVSDEKPGDTLWRLPCVGLAVSIGTLKYLKFPLCDF
jgi:hypothetical protein